MINNMESVVLITQVLILFWIVSLALHIWGCVEYRRISMIGLFCNLVTVLVIIGHIVLPL